MVPGALVWWPPRQRPSNPAHRAPLPACFVCEYVWFGMMWVFDSIGLGSSWMAAEKSSQLVDV